MADQRMLDNQGRFTGTITDLGENQIAHDDHGNVLGGYNKRGNITRDKYGRKIGDGNLLASLFKTKE